jgi:hypothetical protein
VRGDRRADRRKVHVDHVAERVLRVVGDPDAREGTLDPYPLVLLRVSEIVRNVHLCLLDDGSFDGRAAR